MRLRQIMASDEVKESHLRAKTGARLTAASEPSGPVDRLTKLFSSTRLRERLEEEILRASRYGYEIAVVAIDLDKLGDLNEIHGFALGDRLLAEVGNALQGTLRKSDIASRYDGGTFVLMLPHTGEKGKRGVGQRLVRAIGEMEIKTRGGSITPTASAGVAVYPLDGDEKDELIDAAFTAMKRAKLAGGNRVIASRDAA